MPCDEKKLNTKLAKWAGLESIPAFTQPDENMGLLAIYAYLMSKVSKEFGPKETDKVYWTGVADIGRRPSLATCLAIEKLIDKDSTNASH